MRNTPLPSNKKLNSSKHQSIEQTSFKALPLLSSKKQSPAYGATSPASQNNLIYSCKELAQVDTNLKGFQSHSRKYICEEAPSKYDKKYGPKRHFEFYTAPKTSMRHLVKSKHQGLLQSSSHIQSIISRFQDPHTQSIFDQNSSALLNESVKLRDVSLPMLKKPLSKQSKKPPKRMDTQMEQLMEDLREGMKTPGPAETAETKLFSVDRDLRHPLKDGLKLLLLGEELAKEELDTDPVMLLEDAIENDRVALTKPTSFYVQQLTDKGMITVMQKKRRIMTKRL